MTQSPRKPRASRAARAAEAFLPLPALLPALARRAPPAHRCAALSLQSVAVAFIAHPQLAAQALPAFVKSERAGDCTAIEALELAQELMRNIYGDARVIEDTNWFGLQQKDAARSDGVCVERLADNLLLNLLQKARTRLSDTRVQQLYCAMFQTLNAVQMTQCPLLHPHRRLLILCQNCAAAVTDFLEAMASTPTWSLIKTIQALKAVISGLLGVLCSCSPSESLHGSPKVLRVSPMSLESAALRKEDSFSSISDAIAVATPGCVILLAPGTYSETLNIRIKGLVLTSDCVHAGSTRCSCVKILSATSPAVRVLSTCCRFQNIHIASNALGSSNHEALALGGGSLILSHCTFFSVTSSASGFISFIDCEFDNSCRNCVILASGAAATAVDCVFNCSLGYATIVSDSSFAFIRCSLSGVASGIQASHSLVTLVSTTISSTGPSILLQDKSFASLTSGSVTSVASGIVCESSCLIAFKTSIKGNLNTAFTSTNSFIIFLVCPFSKSDKLLSIFKASTLVAVDCSFFDGRIGIDVHSDATVFISRCSFVNFSETAFTSTECDTTIHECRFNQMPRFALFVMGSSNVQALDCFFENCSLTAMVAGLLPFDIETYLKFLLRWKRTSSKQMHSSILLQLRKLPCRLILSFAKPIPHNSVVYLLDGGTIDCESKIAELNNLSASQDSPPLFPHQEEFIQAELILRKSNRDRILMRVISLMALNSIRVAFDKWSLAVAAATHDRNLAEEAAKRATILEASIEPSSGDEEDRRQIDEVSSSNTGSAKERAKFKKKKMRLLEKVRRQVLQVQSTLEAGSEVIYRIDIATGHDFGAGTDANIFCTLTGEDGISSSEFHLLNSAQHMNKFERGQVDTFEFSTNFLGKLCEVTIRTDNTGLCCDWLLDYVTVTVFHSVSVRNIKDQPITFPYGKWLNKKNMIVVLKKAKDVDVQQGGSSIIKKLAGLRNVH